MSEKGEFRRQCISIAAVNPADGKTCEVLISYDRIQTVGRRSLGQAKEYAYIVPEILQHPTAIFEGLRADEDEPRRGAAGAATAEFPSTPISRTEHRCDLSGGKVYLVFVNDEGVAYNWRWEKSDPDNLRLPRDHEARFRKRLL